MIDYCGCSHSTQNAIKNLFAQLDRYALELDIIGKSCSALVRAVPIQPSNRLPFTAEEIDKLWAMFNQPFVDTVLMLLYTGFLLNELLSLEVENINLKDGYFQSGTKTKAGEDRIVPIHPRILEIIKERIIPNNKYLIM